ncbi:unnamed protein product [Triticum turgidum subsp. durum]|uniref:NEDD8-activating enzyme E1 regulatory subunit n=1 Tax=Triticum turgidum subsp. durum TaxID=4567 RepID=A0A9R0U1U1_TRITD|nr:unnamed protein product [Triticum turgidum subsp. durum]
MNFYVLLRAVDRLAASYSRLPGIFDSIGSTSEIVEDVPRLKAAAVSVLSDMGLKGASLSEDLVTEVCRFAGAEIHPVGAFIGGVASQEVIKCWTRKQSAYRRPKARCRLQSAYRRPSMQIAVHK